MRILVVSDAWKPQLNGVVRTYEYLGEELEKRGHDFHVIGPADFPRRFPMPGYQEIELVFFPGRRLREMIESFMPDTIHLATEGPLGKAARKYCIQNKIPFTTAYHTHFPDYVAKRVGRLFPFLQGPVKKMVVRRVRRFHDAAAGVFVATPSLEDELQGWGFQAARHRLTRGVDIDLFKPAETDLFNHLSRPVALYVGRVAIEKNLEAFLEMEWSGAKVIVGDGPDLEMLKAEYPAAVFAGRQEKENLARHYQAADIFVFPSKTETFGMVLVEALAAGLPVAAYDVTGPRDIVTEPFLGALDEEDLSEAAQKALEVKDRKQERYDHVRHHYTWEVVADQFMDVVRQVTTPDDHFMKRSG